MRKRLQPQPSDVLTRRGGKRITRHAGPAVSTTRGLVIQRAYTVSAAGVLIKRLVTRRLRGAFGVTM